MTDFKCKDPFKQCDDWECQKAGKCLSDAPSIEVDHLHDDDLLIVHNVIENEDGTASVQLDLGANALRMLIEIGFTTIMKHGIAMGRETQNRSDAKQD